MPAAVLASGFLVADASFACDFTLAAVEGAPACVVAWAVVWVGEGAISEAPGAIFPADAAPARATVDAAGAGGACICG
jgi:hypothetical protein